MAYLIIPDSDADAESPITQSLMFRMRDNPIFIANADDGSGSNKAPRVLARASGASAIATTDGAVGAVLTVVNEANPGKNNDGTDQGGLLVRPVTKAANYVFTKVNLLAASQGYNTVMDWPNHTINFAEDVRETVLIQGSYINGNRNKSLFIPLERYRTKEALYNINVTSGRGAHPIYEPITGGTAALLPFLYRRNMLQMWCEDGGPYHLFADLIGIVNNGSNFVLHFSIDAYALPGGAVPSGTISIPFDGGWNTVYYLQATGGTWVALEAKGEPGGAGLTFRTRAKVDKNTDYAYSNFTCQMQVMTEGY